MSVVTEHAITVTGGVEGARGGHAVDGLDGLLDEANAVLARERADGEGDARLGRELARALDRRDERRELVHGRQVALQVGLPNEVVDVGAHVGRMESVVVGVGAQVALLHP